MDLLLFTSQYPYGSKAEIFIENEITYLSEAFEKVYVFPSEKIDGVRQVPGNVIVVDLLNTRKYRGNIFKDFTPVLSILFKELIKGNLFNKKHKETVSRLLYLFFKSYELEDWLTRIDANNSIFYTYWFYGWTTVLSVLKKKGVIRSFISRAHGFDLYEERNETGIIPFRRFQLENISKLFLVSKNGLEYISRKYPGYKHKYEVSYLGTPDRGLSVYSPDDTIRILSVSGITKVKRVHLITEVLKNVTRDVIWTHFGDGDLFNDVKREADLLPENITVQFMGMVPNDRMMEFIKNNHFDVFLNLSESEGLPVSIMEALSLGIPVFATDVGGTKEIVNERTGKLFPQKFDIKELLNEISNVKDSRYSTIEFREGVREYWEENLNAGINYKKFIDRVIIIANE